MIYNTAGQELDSTTRVPSTMEDARRLAKDWGEVIFACKYIWWRVRADGIAIALTQDEEREFLRTIADT